MCSSTVTSQLSRTCKCGIIITKHDDLTRNFTKNFLTPFQLFFPTLVLQTIGVSSDGGHGALKRHATPFFSLQVNVCLCCWTLLTNLFKAGYSFSFGIEHVIYLPMKAITSESSILGAQVLSAETLSCYP